MPAWRAWTTVRLTGEGSESASTRPSDNLVSFCKGVDVLLHEAIDAEALRKLVPGERLFKAIVAHHTTAEQAADVFTRVKPRLAVFSHTPGTASIVERARRSSSGRVEMGRDLMVIDIGDEIRISQP